MNHFFTADLHAGHGNILKYCGRTSFMSAEERTLYERWVEDERKGRKWKGTDRFDFKLSPQTVARMDDALVSSINAMVGPDDVLWDLGDWCFGVNSSRAYLNAARAIRDRLRCRTVHHIWGNHDRRDVIGPLFSTTNDLVTVAIGKTGDYWLGDDSGLASAAKSGRADVVVLCHYAMLVWDQSHRGALQLYGHSHSAIEEAADKDLPGRRNMDVGIDNAYRLTGEYRPFSWAEVRDRLAGRPGWRRGESFKSVT